MDFSAILNYTKKAAKSLTVGVVGAVSADKTTGVVPAIAPIPIEAVDTSYAQPEVIKQDPNEPEKDYEEVVVERLKEVARTRSLPYEKKPEVALKSGGLVKSETVAKVAEEEPEVVTPVKNYGESVEQVYKQGAALIISSSMGFLKSLPPTPAKGSVVAEANRLKSIFGIADTPKPQKVIGLKAPLKWWGGMAATGATAVAMGAPQKKEGGKDGGGGFGNPLRAFRNIKKMFKRFKVGKVFKKTKIGKTLRNTAAGVKKVTRGAGKIAKSGGKLVKGASKAGKALLKKGAKKIGAKVGAKAVAKVGAKALGKGLLKKIPFVGMGAGLLFAGQRLLKGDWKGAMMEAASGIASTIPGVGTAVSVGLDAALAAKDMGVLPGQKQAEEQQGGVQAPDPTKDMYGKPIILNPSTKKAWEKAVNAAAKDGINLPMSVTSSYRSPEQQAALIDAAEAGDERAINPAPVGQSPHGQGWAIDIDYYSKANEWMRDKGKKFGFQWQGEKDPVHFDYYNNEPNDKWLKPGKNKWIPNLDDPVGKPSGSGDGGAPQGGGGSSVSPPSGSGSAETLASEPVTQGVQGAGGVVSTPPQIIPVGGKPQVVYVPEVKKESTKRRNTIIDVFGKGSSEVVA